MYDKNLQPQNVIKCVQCNVRNVLKHAFYACFVEIKCVLALVKCVGLQEMSIKTLFPL